MLAADAHVERRGQDGRPAIRETVDHADRRLRAGGEVVAGAGTHGAARVQLRLRVFLVVQALLVDVAARGERPVSRAGDDDAADVVVGRHARDGVVQFRTELLVHRVELRRTVHGQDPDAVRLFDEDVLGHRVSSYRRQAAVSAP